MINDKMFIFEVSLGVEALLSIVIVNYMLSIIILIFDFNVNFIRKMYILFTKEMCNNKWKLYRNSVFSRL